MAVKQKSLNTVQVERSERKLPGIPLFSMQGTPFVMKPDEVPGLTLIFLTLLALARSHKPHWPGIFRLVLAVVWFAMLEAGYIMHSVGHILSARQANAPMDAVVLTLGVHVDYYRDHKITPQQHIARSLGGPLVTASTAGLGYFLWRIFRRVPLLGGLVESVYVMSLMGLALSLTPTPHFDGGSLLKWGTTLQTGEEALGEEAVLQVGFAMAGGVMLTALVLAARRKWTLAMGFTAWAVIHLVDLLSLRK